MSKFGLGKGLGALIPEHQQYFTPGANPADVSSLIQILPLERLKPNPDQPRKTFPEASIDELAASLKKHGMLQPIIAEPLDETQFIIVAGERRYRAAQRAGLAEVPVIVRPVSGEKRLELSLIENIQREDLNPLEEARAYQSLMDRTGATQEQLAEAVGKNRSTVANALRLLRLPEQMQEALRDGVISSGHARSLLAVTDEGARQSLFNRIIAESLSVRQTEQAVQELGSAAGTARPGAGKKKGAKKAGSAVDEAALDPDLQALRELMIEKFGTKVEIKGDLQSGTVAITYFSADDLQRILDVFGLGGQSS
ncbi:MAG: ParB/RepB/Spo0J family partition protein [Spirochaetia bacterium]|nr:ParB/RepB/Spo0J family partition protein [Spirochaetia bacterium]